MSQGLWYREECSKGCSLGLEVSAVLHREQSPFQLIEVIDTPMVGKALVLDGIFMTSVRDEFFYHEMIVHPAMLTAPRIRRVLVIGGGDGGTVREVLRHPDVERCVMVEIDERVVEVSKTHLPEIGSAWHDPRLELRFEDAVNFVQKVDVEPFDVVILDGSDPVGPAEGLFDRSFYEGVRRMLAEDGVFALQSESPTVYEEVFFDIQSTLRDLFPQVHPYFGSVFLYGTGLWTWTWASRLGNPRQVDPKRLERMTGSSRYYTSEIHQAAFAQPAFIRDRLAR